MRLAGPPRVIVLLFAVMLAPAMAVPARAICMVSASPINFGKYSAVESEWIVAAGTISYTCTGPLPVGIKIAIGRDDAAGDVRRVMRGGGSRLSYFLTLDPRGSVPWGDGSAGSTVYFNAHPPRNRTVTIQVYGRIPPGERVPANQTFHDAVPIVAYY
jgi:spore coat protein U-like protein